MCTSMSIKNTGNVTLLTIKVLPDVAPGPKVAHVWYKETKMMPELTEKMRMRKENFTASNSGIIFVFLYPQK